MSNRSVKAYATITKEFMGSASPPLLVGSRAPWFKVSSLAVFRQDDCTVPAKIDIKVLVYNSKGVLDPPFHEV